MSKKKGFKIGFLFVKLGSGLDIAALRKFVTKNQTPILKGHNNFSAQEIIKLMTRFNQGHLHPKLEVPGLTCPGRESNPGLLSGRRALEKSNSKSLLIFITSTHERATSEECSRQTIFSPGREVGPSSLSRPRGSADHESYCTGQTRPSGNGSGPS